MNFDTLLKEVIEKAVSCFNSGNYTPLEDLFSDYVQFTAPAYNNKIVQEPAVIIGKKENLFAYWKKMHTNYPFEVTEIEFLEIGKISRFRNTMKDFGFVIDAEIHFDEYGKVTKLDNTISDIIQLD